LPPVGRVEEKTDGVQNRVSESAAVCVERAKKNF
jgi:hypothetical protein